MTRSSAAVACAALALSLVAPRAAWAGDPPDAPGDPKPPPAATKPDGKPSAPAAGEPEHKGPEIRWALSFPDALEEAAERNVPIYLHSHGST